MALAVLVISMVSGASTTTCLKHSTALSTSAFSSVDNPERIARITKSLDLMLHISRPISNCPRVSRPTIRAI
jgi:hypothetical protein